MEKIKMNGTLSRHSESRIPVLSPSPLRRSGSLRLGTCPPIQEHHTDLNHTPKLNRHRSLQSLNTATSFSYDDDADSVRSFSSSASVCSNLSQCDHAHFGRNGTTYSGRSKRYVVHCSPFSTETDDYLTPTQRTNRTIRKLRSMLKDAQSELIEKDKEIQKLSKEVVQLRLLKVDSGAKASDDEDKTNADDKAQYSSAGDGAQSQSPQNGLPLHTSSPHPRYCSSPPLAHSLTDSGHFEDLNSQSQLSQIKTLESLQRQHEDEVRDLKEKHNDKVESLLQRITDVNDRYYALRPLYEDCKEKLHELEKTNETLKNDPCSEHITQITELEKLTEELVSEKESLVAKINDLLSAETEMESSKRSHDKLVLEINELKIREEEIMNFLDNKKDSCVACNITNDLRDESCQTEQLDSANTLDNQRDGPSSCTCEQNNDCSYKEDNSQLKTQIAAYCEKITHLENELQNEKDIYIQLYEKGIEAAKLQDDETVSEPKQEKENSLIPELLNKLKIKQEELENIKGMYRRLLEARRVEPKHDPEMTLQFLKSAFYYFLTDRENAPGHLTAIESILGFTDNERTNIDKAFLWR